MNQGTTSFIIRGAKGRVIDVKGRRGRRRRRHS